MTLDVLTDGMDGFQSTLPVWGATAADSSVKRRLRFQSTLPVWGATRCVLALADDAKFQSTLPVWGATLRKCQIV